MVKPEVSNLSKYYLIKLIFSQKFNPESVRNDKHRASIFPAKRNKQKKKKHTRYTFDGS